VIFIESNLVVLSVWRKTDRTTSMVQPTIRKKFSKKWQLRSQTNIDNPQ